MATHSYRYLIVGGGMTADAVCQGIRELDESGAIGLVGEEPHAPYKRPPLTKGLWSGGDEAKVWRQTADRGVELHLGRRVISIDPANRFVMGLLRACADTVLVGSGTLRDSQRCLDTRGGPVAADAFRELRHRLGLHEQPTVAIVTSGAGLPLGHPILQSGPIVLTTDEGAAQLSPLLPAAEIVAPRRRAHRHNGRGRRAARAATPGSSPKEARTCSARCSAKGSSTSCSSRSRRSSPAALTMPAGFSRSLKPSRCSRTEESPPPCAEPAATASTCSSAMPSNGTSRASRSNGELATLPAVAATRRMWAIGLHRGKDPDAADTNGTCAQKSDRREMLTKSSSGGATSSSSRGFRWSLLRSSRTMRATTFTHWSSWSSAAARQSSQSESWRRSRSATQRECAQR